VKTRRAVTTSLAAVTLCGLAVVAGALRAAVLCRGDDGHVSIERALAGECDRGAGTEDHLARVLAASAQDGCCGPCSDFAFPDVTLVASSSPASASSDGPPPTGFAWVSHAMTAAVPRQSWVQWTLPSPPIRSLRLASTTVLRC